MLTKNIFNTIRLATVMSAGALVAACGGGGGDGGSTAYGTLQVALTDAPACGYDQVNVTVSKVRVHQAFDAGDNDSGWQEIVLNPARKINLLNLTNGVLQELGTTSLPAGRYTQVRLVLVENGGGSSALANSVVLEGSTEEKPLATPSAQQSGLKLKHQFEVGAGAQVDLVLDFDACKSIVTRGNGSYGLKPVVSVIPKMTSGGITGYVATGLTRPVVSAQLNGVVVKSTVPDAATGAFTLSPVPQNSAGYVVVVTADGRASAAISGVPVTSGANTTVSASGAPITLATSTMRTVGGTITPVDAAGSVRATQTFSSAGQKVEIAYKAADLTSGAYELSLPVGAPWRGTFGALPISLTADSASAGKYGIEASAEGYATQTSDADVSSANVTKNFALLR